MSTNDERPESVGDALALVAKTHALLARASAALEQAPALGPKALGDFVEPVERIHDALTQNLPQLERSVADFL
ncbi:MAG: hypothetical protein E6G92_08670 [Alphaproteobacteria bacterium]|nr:MAG: hypothetical protein E6G92_08670 [Alphaproteobacteria bacterium]